MNKNTQSPQQTPSTHRTRRTSSIKAVKPKVNASKRQAHRLILRRTMFLMIVCGVLMFLPILWKLWYWQIDQHEEIGQKVVRQQTSEYAVSALRGTISDVNGTALAISSETYNIVLSPKAVKDTQDALNKKQADAAEKVKAQQTKGITPSEELLSLAQTPPVSVVDLIAQSLPPILGQSSEAEIREKCQDTNSQYKIIATKISLEAENSVRQFISDNHLAGCIVLELTAKRFYPFSSLAAQTIGFSNDNGGAYGIEAQLEKELSGESGLVVTAKNGRGTDLMNFYQNIYDSENGNNVTTTLNVDIQKMCEDALEYGIKEYDVRSGGFVIAMDCNSGAIRGMASSPSYDLNSYGEIIDQVLTNAIEDGSLTTGDARNKMWRNKALNDTYEPGSTFKSIVLAAGIEEGVISEKTGFNCTGGVKMGGHTLRCSNRSGHGNQTLAEAVGHSCNPAFIDIGQRLGRETFYSYLQRFGLMESTNIDLPGESSNVIWNYEGFGSVQLATASFGQRFTVTPISLITAINAVVNGGYLYPPHVVESITSPSGDLLYQADTTPVRQVISEETSRRCASILEGVVTSYTGRNAYVEGYRIGGKTGTSQTLEEDRYIASFMGFAPADDPQIIVLMAFDGSKVREEHCQCYYSTTGYYISGGNMAAPLVGQLIADILDYQGFEKEYTQADLAGASVSMPNLKTAEIGRAIEDLTNKNLTYRQVGSGSTVTGQCPAPGTVIPGGSEVILYCGEEAPTTPVTVPDVSGMTVEQARATLNAKELYMSVSGSSGHYSSSTLAYKQEPEADTQVDRGSVVTVYFTDSSIADYTGQEIDD